MKKFTDKLKGSRKTTGAGALMFLGGIALAVLTGGAAAIAGGVLMCLLGGGLGFLGKQGPRAASESSLSSEQPIEGPIEGFDTGTEKSESSSLGASRLDTAQEAEPDAALTGAGDDDDEEDIPPPPLFTFSDTDSSKITHIAGVKLAEETNLVVASKWENKDQIAVAEGEEGPVNVDANIRLEVAIADLKYRQGNSDFTFDGDNNIKVIGETLLAQSISMENLSKHDEWIGGAFSNKLRHQVTDENVDSLEGLLDAKKAVEDRQGSSSSSGLGRA